MTDHTHDPDRDPLVSIEETPMEVERAARLGRVQRRRGNRPEAALREAMIRQPGDALHMSFGCCSS